MAAMMVTDLDGTLLDSQSRLSPGNRRILEELGQRGITRMITTGRSLYSARSVIDDSFPIDYLSLSSGALIIDWRSGEIVERHDMSAAQARRALGALVERGMDFMIHRAAPDNHHFHFHRGSADNPDFDRRIGRYREFASRWDGQPPADDICQLIGVEPPSQKTHYHELASELTDLNVVLTTSPLDRSSRWIEIFPPQVSKARSASAIADRLGIEHHQIAAVGNDFNDRDLLEWAHRAFVVANAPHELRRLYTVVGSNDDDGFSDAARVLLDPAQTPD